MCIHVRLLCLHFHYNRKIFLLIVGYIKFCLAKPKLWAENTGQGNFDMEKWKLDIEGPYNLKTDLKKKEFFALTESEISLKTIQVPQSAFDDKITE